MSVSLQSKALSTVLVALLLAVAYLSVFNFVSNHPRDGSLIQKNSQLFGGDFITFYVSGQIFKNHRDRLYDLNFQREKRNEFLRDYASNEFQVTLSKEHSCQQIQTTDLYFVLARI